MAQVMVNFRIDEDVKKNMEQACREMGLSMTAAFTIFATKVSREKRIPFEITAGQTSAGSIRRQCRYPEAEPEPGEVELLQTQKRLEGLCARLRQSLTAIHVAIPASITGLTMEHIRLLCGDELKDKARGVSDACQRLFSQRNGSMWQKKDSTILNSYADGLSSIAEELLDLEQTLIPAMKSCQSAASEDFVPFEQRLAALSRRFDELAPVMQQFLHSTAPGGGGQTFCRHSPAPQVCGHGGNPLCADGAGKSGEADPPVLGSDGGTDRGPRGVRLPPDPGADPAGAGPDRAGGGRDRRKGGALPAGD